MKLKLNLKITLMEFDFVGRMIKQEPKKADWGNEMNYSEKHEKAVTGLAQARWKDIVEETQIVNLNLSMETIVIIRQYFELAYLQGHSDLMAQMQDIYDNDIDLFESMFDQDATWN